MWDENWFWSWESDKTSWTLAKYEKIINIVSRTLTGVFLKNSDWDPLRKWLMNFEIE